MQIHTADWFAPMTEQDMMDKFQVDSNKWEAIKLKHNVRPTTVKRADWEVAQVNNYQTTLQLDRKYPEFFESMDEYIKRFITTTPEVRPYNTQPARGAIDKIHRQHSDILTTTMYTDTHLDKQGKVSMKTRIKNIIESDKRIFDKMDRFASNKQLLAVLWDFFNSDGSHATTKWTPQQSKWSEYDAWKAWTELLAEVLYNRSWYTDIDVIMCQGNHDRHKMMYMRDLLHYYFQNNPNINILKSTENGRYYYKRGINLLWITHGDTIKHADLPMVMNNEWPNAELKERFTWHNHKEITRSYHGMQVSTKGAMSSKWIWNDKYGVDHINNQLFWILHHKKDGKIAQFYEKI
jgi:hypothetical protein